MWDWMRRVSIPWVNGDEKNGAAVQLLHAAGEVGDRAFEQYQ
jgi:hypothetical protein